MKPNTQLNNIIGLALDLADTGEMVSVSIGGNSKSVTVHFGEHDALTASLGDRRAMEVIADRLALRVEVDEVAAGIKAGAIAFAEAEKAIKQHVDKGAQWMDEVEKGVVPLDPTAPGRYA